jgi:hypothetical protein
LFLQYWGLNSGPCTGALLLEPHPHLFAFLFFFIYICKIGAPPPELHLQPILLWLFFGDGGLSNYSPRPASNHDPPDSSLLSSQDYKIIAPMHGSFPYFLNRVLSLCPSWLVFTLPGMAGMTGAHHHACLLLVRLISTLLILIPNNKN